MSRKNTSSQGADDQMATRIDNLSSHMGSLALTKMEWDVSNQVEALIDVNHDLEHFYFQNLESDVIWRSDGGTSSLLAKKLVLA